MTAGCTTVEPVQARKMWRTLEAYHAMIYFVPWSNAPTRPRCRPGHT